MSFAIWPIRINGSVDELSSRLEGFYARCVVFLDVFERDVDEQEGGLGMDSIDQKPIVCDLAIIGSGSAAFGAAIRAVDLKATVVLIEESTIGGTCVNVGCVPSKALLAAAEARRRAMDQPFPGIHTGAGPVVMDLLMEGKRVLVDDLRRDKYEDLATAYGFMVIHGRAQFAGSGRLMVTFEDQAGGRQREVVAAKIVIATGASPMVPPIPGLDAVSYLTSTTAMELQTIPEHLLVIGANAVGLEQAQLFANLGASVTILEARDRIAPFEEPEISVALTQILGDQGIKVVTAATITQISSHQGRINLTYEQDATKCDFEGDALFVATGRRPNTQRLGLADAGVEVGLMGEVIVDAQLQTTNPRIYAAGDVTGAPQFVYVAGLHGTTVVDNALLDAGRSIDYRTMPRVTFTTPQIASVGLTDEGAIAAGYRCDCRVVELSSVPRALVNRDTRGLVKIVADQATNKVLGIHLLADGAADVILAGVYALEANFTVEQLATIWAPYLTMGEAIRLGAQSFTRDVAMLSCCAS